MLKLGKKAASENGYNFEMLTFFNKQVKLPITD